jgi:NADH-quinone oxidoreductase subunit L
VGTTQYATLSGLYDVHLVGHKIFTLPWSWVPLILSVTVAGGGIFLGWLVYGRKPLTADQADPMIAFLGKPLHSFLENKWYWDEAYDRIFVRPTLAFSEKIVYQVIDKGIIDATLHLIANTVYAIGRAMITIEQAVFSDAIDWLKDKFLEFANEFRTFQSGKVQEYALLSMLIVFVFATFLLIVNAVSAAG